MIRLDKCTAFGMEWRNNSNTQILPNLNIVAENIQPVAMNGEFIYLGKRFCFDQHNCSAKLALEKKIKDMLLVTNGLKVKAQTKLKILSLYIHSQLLFEIKLYGFPVTWVEQTLDAHCMRYIRD